MEISQIPITEITPYARNPRRNEAAVAKVAASIKEFGFRQPIVVDGERVVIVGHTRLEAARMLGIEQVPVHVAQGLTSSQVKAYRLADNRTGEDAEWDAELLALELDDLDGEIDFDVLGFGEDDLVRLGIGVGDGEFPDINSGDRGDDSLGTITILLPIVECSEIKSWLDSIDSASPSLALLKACRDC